MAGAEPRAIPAFGKPRPATRSSPNHVRLGRIKLPEPQVDGEPAVYAKLRAIYLASVHEAKKMENGKKRDWELYEACFMQAELGFPKDALRTANLIFDLLVKSFAYLAMHEFSEKHGVQDKKLVEKSVALANEYKERKKKNGPEDVART